MLNIMMEAELEGENPVNSTPISLTNHSYFNLAGHDSAEGINNQKMFLDADNFTPYDENCIPTRVL